MPKMTITLADRVWIGAEAVRTIRAKAAQIQVEETQALEQLALAEAEVLGKGAGWEGVALSGLIEEGKNPYYQAPKKEYTAAERAAAAGVTMERPADADEPEPFPLEDPEPEDEPEAKKASKPHKKG